MNLFKKILFSSLVISFLALTATVQAANLADAAAEISVKGEKIAKATLKEGANVHTNRDYYYKKLNSKFAGMDYLQTSHRSKTSLEVQVSKPGKLYLCIISGGKDGAAPSSPQGWTLTSEKIGTFGDDADTNLWVGAIYVRDCKKDEKVLLSSDATNKWGPILFAKKINGIVAAAPATARSSGSAKKVEVQLGEKPEEKFAFNWKDDLRADAVLRDYHDIKSKLAKRPNEKQVTQAFRQDALILPEDKRPLDVILRRTRSLLNFLTEGGVQGKKVKLDKEAAELTKLEAQAKNVKGDEKELALFGQVYDLRRRIAFTNPLINFKDITFATRNLSRGNHMCDQYFGKNATQGGGIYVLQNAFADEGAQVRNILANSTIATADLAKRLPETLLKEPEEGQKGPLGRLDGLPIAAANGGFVSLELSYDGKELLFGWTEIDGKEPWGPGNCFHIFRCNVDGTNLRQLTDGGWNDFDPCFLPDGRIVFNSERRGGFGRCHGRPVPTYTLHSMKGDGSEIEAISFHETNEWHPSVDNNGMLVYSRWDYVDRDSDIAHHLWVCFPDGRDPRSYHGNYPLDRKSRPWMELAIRAIPGSPKYIATAAPHHGQNHGSLVLIDQRIKDDREMSQVRRLTPMTTFPESEGYDKNQSYGQAWPLSEDFYLCVYSTEGRKGKYGIYLVDSFGNRLELYRDKYGVSCLDPIPLQPRKKPPVIPRRTELASKWLGPLPASGSTSVPPELMKPGNRTMGTASVMNVYDAEFPFPEGTQIKQLRIVQVFPKNTPSVDKPRIGIGAQSLTRGILGVVPVEKDGSAHFELPAGVPVYFQCLDEKGCAVQTMRSNAFVHAGEHLSCIGCHENKNETDKAGRQSSTPQALKRAASKLQAEFPEDLVYPISFPRFVKPVLEKHCGKCHKDGKDKAPKFLTGKLGKNDWFESYQKLSGYGWAKSGGNGAIRRNGGCISYPGKIGYYDSKLHKILTGEKHAERLKNVPPQDLRRISAWIDCNTVYFGEYEQTHKQNEGERIMPKVY